jgi:hypothetical protein
MQLLFGMALPGTYLFLKDQQVHKDFTGLTELQEIQVLQVLQVLKELPALLVRDLTFLVHTQLTPH